MCSLVESYATVSGFSSPTTSDQSTTSRGTSTAVTLVIIIKLPVRSRRPAVQGSGLFPMGTGKRMQFLSITSVNESNAIRAPMYGMRPSERRQTSPISADYLAASSDYIPEGARAVTNNTSLTPEQESLPALRTLLHDESTYMSATLVARTDAGGG